MFWKYLAIQKQQEIAKDFESLTFTEMTETKSSASTMIQKTESGGNTPPGKAESSFVSRLGERITSDVIVRLRTVDGRDDWIYAHSVILTKKSKYFADRLSDDWPTCHLLDSRNCIEVLCKENDVDHHVTLLRLLYLSEESMMDMWYNVKNALGILRVATKLGCDNIVSKCVQYLEAMPWEESEEDEILKTLPCLGAVVIPVLARLQPVDPEAIRNVFLSAIRVAILPERSSELVAFSSELRTSAQEQVEYMLVEDDDAPLLIADDKVKVEVKKCFLDLFEDFKVGMMDLMSETLVEIELSEEQILKRASDLVWTSRILPKLNLLSELVVCWEETSDAIMQVLRNKKLKTSFWETKFKVVELTGRVLEAVGYGNVILPTSQRTHLVRVWLSYIRDTKPLLDAQFSHDKMKNCMDGDLCQSIEAAIVSLVLSLPSGDQAEILADWLQTEQARYPDLSEAFEVWCYRTKAAKRRLALYMNGIVSTPVNSVGR
eukprot:c26805_g1_i1 orf=447-1916(-)